MKVDIFTYCDFATIYGNKLCITGSTDVIYLPFAPAKMAGGCIVLKIRFEQNEEGKKSIKISMIDADGNPVVSFPLKQIEFAFDKANRAGWYTHFQIDRITAFEIEKFGEYTFHLSIDGNEAASIPFYFLRIPQKKP